VQQSRSSKLQERKTRRHATTDERRILTSRRSGRKKDKALALWSPLCSCSKKNSVRSGGTRDDGTEGNQERGRAFGIVEDSHRGWWSRQSAVCSLI